MLASSPNTNGFSKPTTTRLNQSLLANSIPNTYKKCRQHQNREFNRTIQRKNARLDFQPPQWTFLSSTPEILPHMRSTEQKPNEHGVQVQERGEAYYDPTTDVEALPTDVCTPDRR